MTVEVFDSCSSSIPQSISPSPSSDVVEVKVDATPRTRKRPRMARLVSQDEIKCMDQRGSENNENCPVAASQHTDSMGCCTLTKGESSKQRSKRCIPFLPNPLRSAQMMHSHVEAIRLEADLHPMRLILSRLMAPSPQNRKGLFNRPVDPVALGLPDYHLIVTNPMDLGSVKSRLHAIAYQSRQQVADDIRLVFTNAMRYNPQYNFVHKCAREMLESFESAYKELESIDTSNESKVATSTQDVTPGTTAQTMVTPCVERQARIERTLQLPITSQGGTSEASSSSLPINASEISASTQENHKYFEGQACKEGSQAQLSSLFRAPAALPKVKSRTPPQPHSCYSCLGRKCAMCKQGCLSHEPALLICQGFNCAGAKIRKGATYYVAADGSRQFCQRCYTSLPPIFPQNSEEDCVRYKQDMLKRTNIEEIAEDWITCVRCKKGVHQVCAMHNEFVHSEESFVCFSCQDAKVSQGVASMAKSSDMFTFVSGSDTPVPLGSFAQDNGCFLKAEDLQECPVSSFIQEKVRECMRDVPDAEKTVVVRIISDCSRHFNVPKVVQRHFRMVTDSEDMIKPPTKVNYQQKAITLFQKIDGLDVCIFCMYVQEYDGNDEYEGKEPRDVKPSHQKRVYIAYLDSVEHFRPRRCRTRIYQEMLVSYLACARKRGYECAHIWACPPSRGNSFVFWNHPASQRTPTKDRLVSWYHGALSRAIACGVVTDVKSLFESDFKDQLDELEREYDPADDRKHPTGKMACPPLLEGDFWIEEAVRLHSASIARHLKTKSTAEVCVWNVTSPFYESLDPCPALQVASLIRDRIMTHPCSVPFRRPVNAAALKLKDYHKIVVKPMDLGTIYSRCIHGEYHELREIVSDIQLMVSNAKKFNPVGHFVYIKADEVLQLFFSELLALTNFWTYDNASNENWERFADMSMSLDRTLDLPRPTPGKLAASVVIEDDRSSDGSRSLGSSSSASVSPAPANNPKEDDDSVNVMTPKSLETPKARRENVLIPTKRTRGREKKPIKKLELLTGGAEAVMQHMVGEDTWLMEKRCVPPPKVSNAGKKQGTKRRRNVGVDESSMSKRRRQSWLGEEVSDSVRNMRTSFFMCSLTPKDPMTDEEHSKLDTYLSYTEDFPASNNSNFTMSSKIANARHALLEFSQFRHFEFDTLRRAKYSTTMLLYHLQNDNAPGMIPTCTSCDQVIQQVRWHKVKKPFEKKRYTKVNTVQTPQITQPEWKREELCTCCHSKLSKGFDDFIPIPVSLKP